MTDQEKAYRKLSRLKVGALFMAMGTGKTKVALDLIASKAKKTDYVLWICPFSLKGEIEAERQKWHPELQLDVVGCESIGSSDRIYLETLNKVTEHKTFTVVDESLKIKNRKAKRTQRIIEIGRKSLYRLILNGTPISKNYCDIWAQMEFLSPKILHMSFREFYNTYCEYYQRGKLKGKIRNFVNIPHLIDRISPYVFDADLDLSTKRETNVRYYYCDAVEYYEAKQAIFDECYNISTDDLNFNTFALKLQMWYTQNSTRQEAITDLIDEIDDKVIVFVRFLASIPSDAHCITGADSANARNRKIEQFREGEFKVLYITYGCGAYGLNLQFCHNMIFAEHTWDYAVREQAEARIYRMGQEHDVRYFDMKCADSGLEEKIFRCIDRKENMLDTVKTEIQKLGAKEWVKNI